MPRIGTLLSLVVAFAPLVAPATPQRAKKPTLHALRGKLHGVRDRKSALRSAIHRTRARASAVKRTIVVVDTRLLGVETRLATTHRKLGGAKRDQRAADGRLAQATLELSAARERARARLRALGKQGTGNLLATFVAARSVGDLASRRTTMAQIARRDGDIFARVKATKRTVTRRKAERDATVDRVVALQRQEKVQRESLRSLRVVKGRELVGLRTQEADQVAALRQFEADERQIARLIALASRPVPRKGRAPFPKSIGRFLMPVAAPITSGFGMRYHPILHRVRLHAGVDFGAPTGTPVRCAAAGRVIAATRMGGFGNVVIVDHGGGVSTVYGHLSRISVRAGNPIARGSILGAVGMTGLATGPHLHWEVHVDGRAVDPRERF